MLKYFKIIGILIWFPFLLAGCGSNASLSTLPQITGITPMSAAVGTVVTITGANFSTTPANNAVSFNGTVAVVTKSTATQLITVVPMGATTGPITVTISGYSVTSATSFTVTVLIGGSIQGFTISPVGSVTTLVGAGIFSETCGVTTDGTDLFVTDDASGTIWRIAIATGAVSTFVGAGSFSEPCGITTDGTNLYVTDYGNRAVSKVAISTGSVTTFVGAGSFSEPYGITTDGTNLYVTDDFTGTISKVVIATGAVSTFVGAGVFTRPQGVTTDGTNLYVTDYGKGTISKVVIATG
jgi:hypothetical protein